MDPDLFTVKVYHSGQIERSSENVAKYVDGQIDYFDFCIGDWMSMIELKDFAARLGYEKNVLFYSKVLGQDTFGCYEPLHDHMDVFGMVSAGLPFREAEVYMVVPTKSVQVNFAQSENEPIEELFRGEKDYPAQDVGQSRSIDDDILHDVDVYDQTQGTLKNHETMEDDGLIDYDFREDTENCISGKKKNVFTMGDTFDSLNQDSHVDLDSDVDWSADDFSTECESDEDAHKRKYKFNNFNTKADMENPIFRIGMVFPTADHFRKAIREYSILNSRGIRFSRNEKRRIRAICGQGCPWVVYASSIGDDKKDTSVVIKTVNEKHMCTRVFEKKWISCSWLAEKYREKWADDPGWKPTSFFREIRNKTGVQLSPWQYYRSRRRAMEMIQGTIEEQYTMLWDYCEALKESNQGITVKMKLSEEENNQQFQRLYICFGACKQGWKAGCRRLIGLDGCHMKGPHEGHLLSAVGIDGDNSIFPIAYAAVESESLMTWTWFLDYLAQDLDIVNSHTVTWMTDKQKGLVESVSSGFPNSAHRFCVRHLYNNFKLHHKGLHLKQLLWKAARVTTMMGYKQEMEKMKLIDPSAYQWLASRDPQHWCRAFFSRERKCDILLNNLCEVFNAAILEARDQPIITCMDIIRRYISKRLVSRKAAIMKWNHEVGPRVFKIIEKNKMASTKLIPDYCGDDKFEVRCYSMDQFRVDLSARSCDCTHWQLSGIPCAHAISCILSRDLSLMDYVDDCYKKNTVLKAYEIPIRPMHGPNLWKRTNAIPPTPPAHKKMPGRPKKSRRKEPKEIGPTSMGTKKLRRNYITMTCRLCGGKGHNRVSCPNKGPSLPQFDTHTRAANKVASSRPRTTATSSTRIAKGASSATQRSTMGTKTNSRKEKGKEVASKG